MDQQRCAQPQYHPSRSQSMDMAMWLCRQAAWVPPLCSTGRLAVL
jgi:hypothetical protein